MTKPEDKNQHVDMGWISMNYKEGNDTSARLRNEPLRMIVVIFLCYLYIRYSLDQDLLDVIPFKDKRNWLKG